MADVVNLDSLDALAPLLEHTTLLDVRWLLRLAKKGGVLPAWQNLPPDAVATMAAMKGTAASGIGNLLCRTCARERPRPP